MAATKTKKPKAGEAQTQDVLPVEPVGNGARGAIELTQPYRVSVTIQGSAPLMFHRWDTEAVEAKAKAAKGSEIKKTDDPETFIWRDENDFICLPGEYLRMSIVNAAKYKQDPRSPRKSGMDLFKAGVVAETVLAPVVPKGQEEGSKEWDYIDARRVNVQRNAVTRRRPTFDTGWSLTVVLLILLPEYISPEILNEVIANAGKVVGVAEYRPTYGRFQVTHFEVLED